MIFTPEDEVFLRRTFKLARKGVQSVSPNPVVGAVVVKNNRIIAEGWHLKTGCNHAEVNAIESAGDLVGGSTIYVNLEPCCHYGRTPPCTKAIINAGITRVVACTVDPNPLVNGGGFKELLDAGVEISFNNLVQEAEKLNEVYFHFMKTGKPFIHIKAGMSMDGRIASSTGKSQWITSEKARRYAHRLRQRYDSILVGFKTLMMDDPRLDVRIEGGGVIHRIVLDSQLNISLDAKLLKSQAGGDVIIATTDGADKEKIKTVRGTGAKVIICEENNNKVDLGNLIDHLGELGITSMMVEGGGETIASFLKDQLVNKVTFVYAPMIIGGRKSVPVVSGGEIDNLSEAFRLKDLRSFKLGSDIGIEGYPVFTSSEE